VVMQTFELPIAPVAEVSQCSSWYRCTVERNMAQWQFTRRRNS
jgi:hypothetical protein